jgi:hypothetical protein
MSLFRLSPLAIGLAVALGFALPAAPGQEGDKGRSRTAEATSRVAHQVYALRGGQPKDLANVLNLHFKGEPAFLAVPDPGSNSLLLSGSKSVLNDALAVLQAIDRPARAVRVELLLIEWTGKVGAEAGAGGKDLDERVEWEGPARDVTAKLRDLQKRGLIARVQRIQLTALDRQSVRTQAGESRPYTTGVALAAGFGSGSGTGVFPGGRAAPGGGTSAGKGAATAPPGRGGPGGMMSRSISYRNVGTSVQIKPEIGADGVVALELHVEDSRMRTAGGVALATDEQGTNVPATEFVNSTLESRLRVRPGHVVLAQDTATVAKVGQTQTVVLVSAVIEEAGR